MDLDKLDRLAAEKILGWEYGFSIYHGDYKRTWKPGETAKDYPGLNGSEGWLRPEDDRNSMVPAKGLPKDWQPTRNIAQAWELLERCKSNKDLDIFETRIIKTNYAMWSCQFWLSSGEWSCAGEDDTAPLAITKACLKAKGIEV